MRVSIVRASELTSNQLAAVDARVAAPEHCKDRGGCLFWHRDAALAKMFVAVLSGSRRPIGIVHVDGPLNHVHPAWWVDSRFRGQGLGGEMIDALATVLKADGYSGVGRITIDSCDGEYDQASSSLVRRLQAHFSAMN